MSQTRTTKTAKAAATGTAEVFAKGQDTVEQLFRAGTEALSGNYDKWIKFNQERATAVLDSFKGWDDVGAQGKETVEAWMAGGRIAAKGLEDITDKWLAFVTASLEDGVAASRAMFECKDVKQLMELQSKQLRKLIDGWMTEGAEISELTLETATKAMAPIGERVNAAIEKATHPTD
ncbi:MAG TPA: phasin family protein [Alphaproteobacteria bacterium]